MNNEFTIKVFNKEQTVYVLENATSGGTSAGAVASVPGALGKVKKRDNILAQEANKKKVPATTPRNFVAKNAKTGGAGAHKDKKKAAKQGDTKHKSKAIAEGVNGEYDDEAGMAKSNLHTAARSVAGLLDTIKSKDNLPEWVQEKIAKAEMSLTNVWDYLQSQKEQGIDPQQGVAEGSLNEFDPGEGYKEQKYRVVFVRPVWSAKPVAIIDAPEEYAVVIARGPREAAKMVRAEFYGAIILNVTPLNTGSEGVAEGETKGYSYTGQIEDPEERARIHDLKKLYATFGGQEGLRRARHFDRVGLLKASKQEKEMLHRMTDEHGTVNPRTGPEQNADLNESTSLQTTLRAIVNDIDEPVKAVYATLKSMAEKYIYNNGKINKGWGLISGGVGSKWVENFYEGRLKNELHDLVRYNPRYTAELKQFLAGQQDVQGNVILKRSFTNISQNLPDILYEIGKRLKVPQLAKNAMKWQQDQIAFETFIENSKNEEDDEIAPKAVAKNTSSGQQNAQVDQIINQTLNSLPANIRGDIRNAISRSSNKLLALQQELKNRNIQLESLSNLKNLINELTNKTLASYKKKAGEQATAADAAGDYKKGNKRFSGIVKATKKQFANDSKKKVSENDQSEYKEIVLFVDNRPISSYTDAHEAEKDLIHLKRKFPNKDLKLRYQHTSYQDILDKKLQNEISGDAVNELKTDTQLSYISKANRSREQATKDMQASGTYDPKLVDKMDRRGERTMKTINKVVAKESKKKVSDGIEWLGNTGGTMQSAYTDHTLEDAEAYFKSNYPLYKKYAVTRADPGFLLGVGDGQGNFIPSPNYDQVVHRFTTHMKSTDSAVNQLQLQKNTMVSGSSQPTRSIGYSWHVLENPQIGVAVLYYQDRGMGGDELIIGAKDKQNLSGAIGIFRDAGTIPDLGTMAARKAEKSAGRNEILQRKGLSVGRKFGQVDQSGINHIWEIIAITPSGKIKAREVDTNREELWSPGSISKSMLAKGQQGVAENFADGRAAQGYRLLQPDQYPAELSNATEFIGSDVPFVLGKI